MKNPNFYAIIIGTELLNGRREDQHFTYVNNALTKRGWTQKASFIIDDEPAFIEKIFSLVKDDPHSVLFCFGGIGSTPDDYTRQAAANIFDDGKLELHTEAAKCIISTLGENVDPLRLAMGYFPKQSDLLKNVINNIPGFSLENRFFFMPGFPSMSHPMVDEALNRYFPHGNAKFRRILKIAASEGTFLELMTQIPHTIEFSSLPHIDNHKKEVEISFASYHKEDVDHWIKRFIDECQERNISYEESK